MLEKTFESPLDTKEIKPVNPKGNQLWIFIWRTDAEAETPLLWQPDAESRLIGKHPDDGKDWRWEEKGTTEDKMVGWHYWLNGHDWANSGRQCRAEKPGVLQSTGSQRVWHVWKTEQQYLWSLKGLRKSDSEMLAIFLSYPGFLSILDSSKMFFWNARSFQKTLPWFQLLYAG